MVESFLSAPAYLPGSCSCCLEQLFRRKPVSACFCRKKLVRRPYLRILKARKTESCSLQGCFCLKGNPLGIPSWKNSVSFKAPFRNLVRSSFLVALQTVDFNPATPVKRRLLDIS